MQLMDLDVPVAYHSHHVDPCTEPLAKALEGLVATPPDDVILVSAVTGERVTEAPGVDYWVVNLRQPVLFDQAVVQSRDPKHKPHFVEIGPKPVLRSHLPDIFPKDDMPCVMSMSKPPEYKVLLQALVSLYQYGVDIKWTGLPTLGTKVTDVPRYVFDKKKNLAKSETAAIVLSGVDEKAKNHPYAYPLANSTGFKLIITPLGLKSVYDHIISGRIVIPGAFYAETGFAIAKHFNPCSGHNFAVAVDFEQALTVPKDGIMEIDVHFTENTKEADKWKAPIRVMREKRLLAHIRITEIMVDQSPQEVINLDQIKARCLDEISRDTIYNALRSAGFQYGETFCLLEAAYKNNEECMATLRVHKNVMEELPGTTIHPSILDCMLQSSLVITMDTDGKGGNQRDLLPKALGRVVVHRPMEPLMVVHTRIRVHGQKQNFYDLKLLSTSGHFIAELDGLVINLIMEAQESSLPDMFTMEWSHVRALSPNGTMPEGKHVVYLTDLTIDKTLLSDQQVVASIMDLDFTQGMPPNIRQVIAANKKAHAFVLLCLEPVFDSIDSDSLDRHILNQSFLYKEMLLLANELALSAPIYLCTRNAWPSPIVGNFDQPVNPASTGLWGLCRTVLRERIYPNIVTVEFQMPSQDLTASFFETTFDVLLKETEVQNHPELMVTPDGIHLNLIVIVDPETPIPMFRSNVVSRDKSALLLSSESSALVKPVAVLHDVTSASGPDEKDGHSSLRINAQAFALPSPALLKLKMQYERLQRDKASKANGYTVFSVEVMGTAPQLPSNNNENHKNKNQNNKNNRNNLKSIEAPSSPVVACYPVAVGTQVLIPASATLRTDLLPGYELGDLTKLVVLFELQKRVGYVSVFCILLQSSVSVPVGSD